MVLDRFKTHRYLSVSILFFLKYTKYASRKISITCQGAKQTLSIGFEVIQVCCKRVLQESLLQESLLQGLKETVL